MLAVTLPTKSLRAGLVAALMLLPALATAHAKLTQSMPANGSVLTRAPAQIQLTFNEPARITALNILKSGDKAATKLGPLPRAVSATFMVALPKLAPGKYTVTYRVMGDDNHLMSGSLTFSVSAGRL